MEDHIFIGRGKHIHPVPQSLWMEHLEQIPQHSQSRLSFMTEEHHQVRNLAVQELVARQKPIEPEFISDRLNIPLEKVNIILEDLEIKLFFLVRNRQGAVAWAYPVTVEATPHRIKFSSGEQLYGA